MHLVLAEVPSTLNFRRHTSIDFNATDGNRYTALMLAIQKGIMSVVVELIRFKDRMDRK